MYDDDAHRLMELLQERQRINERLKYYIELSEEVGQKIENILRKY